jgi:hypothetical protein
MILLNRVILGGCAEPRPISRDGLIKPVRGGFCWLQGAGDQVQKGMDPR